MIFSVLNQKGGVGKTTISTHLAFSLSENGKKVLLLDADPQGSSKEWVSLRNDIPFTLMAMDKPIIHKQVEKMKSDYDYIVIDGSPRLEDLARSCIMASDFVIIPVQPSQYDISSTKGIVNLIGEACNFTENLKSAFVINRKVTGTVIGKEAAKALMQFEIPTLKTTIGQRISITETAGGKTVFELEPNSVASKEFKNLTKEVLEVSK